MNELDKADLNNETVNPAKVSVEAENPKTNTENSCQENVCAETESPALNIEEVADEQADDREIEQSESAGVPANIEMLKKIHVMDKPALIETLTRIVEEKKLDAHKEVAAIKQTFYSIKSKESLDELNEFVEAGNDPANFSASADEYEQPFKDLYSRFKELRAAFLEEEEARKQRNLTEKREILSKLKAIATDIDNINLKFPEFQQLQADFKDIKDIPAPSETEIWKEYQLVTEEFYDHLKMNKELRDLDFKKNLEAKRQLIEEAKALEENPDTIAAFRKLQELHNQWRELGPVAKEIRESIWDEFKAASTVINKRHQEFFERRKASEQANEEGKTALCERVEAIDTENLNTFALWDEATKQIIEIQAEWKTLGFASRKANNLLFSRFRKACDDFFEKKTEYFRKTKENLNENLEKKTALCERVEALKDSKDLKKATDEVVKLQSEWKKIGGVPRKQSDAIWQRFTTACNYLFDLRKKENSARRQEENANLAAKREIIEKLKAIPKDSDKKEVGALVRELQQAWQKIGFVPFKHKDKLYTEYREAVDALYSSFNLRENRARMSSFKDELENIKGDAGKIVRERDRLLRVYEAKKNDLKNIENNMGFFNVKSSAGSSMVKDMERRIRRLKEEMAEVEQKIAMLDENK